ncbi:MAG TPA: TRAM domain-containing protein, partial [Ignavibacteriaceae bacterium]
MKKGDIIQLEIEKYGFEGKGIAKVRKSIINDSGNDNDDEKNYVVFVSGAFPGDKVNARLLKIKKSYADAKAVEILTPSKFRIKPECKYFGVCGGCRQQDLIYKKQLKFKQQQVKEIFEHIGGLTNFEFPEIIPSEKIFYYRNKMEFSFADRRWLTKNEIGNPDITDLNFAL